MDHNEQAFENQLVFTISRNKKIMHTPQYQIQSSSPGRLQEILDEIAPQVAEYIEKLLVQKKLKMKWDTLDWE
jgi:putative lipoic acid-binding regulatory protein